MNRYYFKERPPMHGLKGKHVLFNKLLDEYEETLTCKSGKKKEYYIGQIGTIIHYMYPKNPEDKLYDVMFQDGTILVLEYQQFDIVD